MNVPRSSRLIESLINSASLDDIAIVESFSHMVALELKRGLSYLMQAASRAESQLLIHCESGIQIGFTLWFIHMGT